MHEIDERSRVELAFDEDEGCDVVFQNAWIRNYESRRLASHWVLSNQAGSWLIVTEEEKRSLDSVAIGYGLYKKLEERCLILTSSNGAVYYDQYRHWTSPHFRHPSHHIIVSTLRCNLACSYCHAAIVPASAGPSFDLDTDTADAILEFSLNSPNPVQSFEFQGGESILNFEILKYLIPKIRSTHEALGRTVYVSVQTNGTILTDRVVEFLRAYSVKIGTSLDGTEAVHDANRRYASGKGTFGTVSSAVQRYRLPVLPTITRQAASSWRDIVDAELERRTGNIHFHNVYPINSARNNWATVGMSGPEYLKVYQEVTTYLRTKWEDGYYPIERRMRLALKKLLTGRDVDFADFGNPCGMVHSQIAYLHNGDVYTCDEGRDFPEFRLGNVKTDSYDSIVFGSRMRKLKSLSLPSDEPCMQCAYRPFCSTCPVYERAVTGEIHSRHAATDNCNETLFIYDQLFSWFDEDCALMMKVAAFHGI